MHGFPVHPFYAKGQQRRNIFFSQVCETLVGSCIHEEGRNKASASLALLVVDVPAIGEVMVRPLFDFLDFDGLSRFHGDQSSRGLKVCKIFFINNFFSFTPLTRLAGTETAPNFFFCIRISYFSWNIIPLSQKWFYFKKSILQSLSTLLIYWNKNTGFCFYL